MSESIDVVMAEEQLPQAGFNPKGLGDTIFKQRYARYDSESWESACDRVATHVAQAENGSREKWRGRFYQKLSEGLFVPGGRIWYGSGRAKGQLLNCFVVPTDDSREGWGQTVKDMLIISGTGGGVGTNYSPIRPRGTPIKGTGGEATGAVSLMEIINQTGEVIKAGGGRRTALMMCLRYDHADIMEFLNAKLDLERLNNANVSVLVDDDFFKQVENNDDIVLKFRDRPVLDSEGNERTIPAQELWDKIIQNSYNSAEPGILNIGLANKMNNIHYYKPLIATNPCGEIWLESYGCCCLGAVNLAQHITDGEMDWESLADTVNVGVRLLDNVLDVNQYPIKEIEINCQKVRRIGLGIMGLGHALVKMGYTYGSEEGNAQVDKMMKFIKERAYEASTFLAVERGPFEAYTEDFLNSGFVKTLPRRIKQNIREHGVRNCALLTIAPTGTTSMVMGTSSGIEPIFAPGYIRRYYDSDNKSNDRILKEEMVIDPLFKELYESGADMSSFIATSDLSVRNHMEVQAICQKHIDNSISKTINIPNEYDISDYGDLMLEFGPQLKGITVYRQGSRGNEPLTPITVEQAIESLKSDEAVEGAAATDCPSGVCELPVSVSKE
ncbi:MAG: ribonucleoside-diphosphate reductase, adenosylcobalamin-dependent [Rhodobacteraceae bacterium]|nr:ribonucleoside-diphosphate reductase, adenosylcobalamin-dependent [Paracoccaceae bacterium]|tara:strand:+ start:5586 stop:7421 length:1836 start_codon:yes stop_codon:yes gene_type:complete